MVSCWSYWTMFTVIEELAQRVADRSPPSKFTSTASAFAMLRTLSVSALISSREYIMDSASLSKRRAYEELRSDAVLTQCSTPRRRIHLRGARHAENVRRARTSLSRAGVRGDDDGRGRRDTDNRWHPDGDRPVHASGRVRAIGPDGGGLLHSECAARLLADRERRRARRPVLFHLAVHLRRRPRADQPRRAARKIMTRSEKTAEDAKHAKKILSSRSLRSRRF